MTGVSGFYFTNWARTFSCSPELYFTPKNVDELKHIVQLASEAKKRVRVVGCGHSPSDIACTTGYMVSLKKMNKALEVDLDQCRMKVEAGATVEYLDEVLLPKYGLALSVHGSVSNITLAGAISTGTHGSGIKYGTFASFVIDMELMTAQGKILHCSREENQEIFLAALCGLGAIGIIVTLTIQCEPAFNLREIQEPMKLDEVCRNLSDHVSSSDHFRFMFYPHTDDVLCYHISRTNKKATTLSWIRRAYNWILNYGIGYYLLEFLYWLGTFFPSMVPSINRVYYTILFNRKRERVDISYKVFNFECLFKQYANEWAIPWEKTTEVLYELKNWIDTSPDAHIHYSVEVRFVKADDIYLSPAYNRNSCYVNIVMYRPYGRLMPYQNFWDVFESVMKKAGGRPHWAKAHRVGASEFQHMYPMFKSWMKIRKMTDPDNMFINAYLKRIFSS